MIRRIQKTKMLAFQKPIQNEERNSDGVVIGVAIKTQKIT